MAIALVATGCTVIPKGAVVFFPENVPDEIEGQTEPVPREWHGRLVGVGTGNPELAGSNSHTHTVSHKHEVESAATGVSVAPVGVAETTAGAEHTHAVESFATTPAVAQDAPNMPASYGVRSAIVRSRVSSVPEGMIIAFLGEKVPEAYRECDGKDGTPNLSGRHLLITHRPGPTGIPRHSHQTRHRHTWGGAESGSPPAYAHDQLSAPGPGAIRASAPNHRHVIEESQAGSTSSTGEGDHAPPSVAVRFIQATADAEELPVGALLPFTGGLVPNGWSEVRVIRGNDVVGRFIRGTTAGLKPGSLSGSATHFHAAESAHALRLLPAASQGPIDRPADAPPVAEAGHDHAAAPSVEFRTGAAPNSPPVVRLRFILKN